MLAAAFEEVDTTPMEGFDPEAVDEILYLKAKNLRSVILLPIGYRAAEGDWLVNLKKVKRSTENFVTFVKKEIIMFCRIKYRKLAVLFPLTDQGLNVGGVFCSMSMNCCDVLFINRSFVSRFGLCN